MKAIRSLALLLPLVISLLSNIGCGREMAESNGSERDPGSAIPSAVATDGLPFGNPSGATADPKNDDNYLLIHDSHVLSYNNSRGTMNWAAWRTTRADLGDRLPRADFRPDPDLPNGFLRVAYYDYSGSGYDRGHMVPSADRFANRQLNAQTFLMTNIVPQTPALNQFPWNKLEIYVRSLARRGNLLYTIGGVYGEKGVVRGKVTAPTNCWKVIVVLRPGAADISSSTRIIAVDMPNADGIENIPWEKYKTTVRSIEEKTGLDIFSKLPQGLQDLIETRQDPDTLRSP